MREEEEEVESMVTERIMVSLAEKEGSGSDLKIKGGKCDLWQSEGLVGT